MLIKLDEAIAAVAAVQTHFDDGTVRHPLPVLADATYALRALPVSDGWEDIATEPAGLIEAIMNAGPIGCCNINERNASDILFEISEYMKAKKGE